MSGLENSPVGKIFVMQVYKDQDLVPKIHIKKQEFW